ncbi:MAG: TVP38/TMEM64 family protein [Prochlorotrichaceae cyanobacterium]
MKWFLSVVLFIATALTVVFLYQFRQLEIDQLRSLIASTGFIAPLIYIGLYSLSTLFLLPSTPLNLLGGILFGAFWGTLWTSSAALLIAIVSFVIAREFAAAWVQQRFGHYWQGFDRELRAGGAAYLFALRLLPILPYGLVNFGAGLTSIRYSDYLLGTLLGTVPGIFPFVWLGSLGLQAVSTGEVLPLLFPLSIIGLLVGGATWYQRHSRTPKA